MSVPAPAEPTAPAGPEAEVVDLCRDLIRIPSVNYGDGSGPGERAVAERVAALLAEVGIEPTVLESEPGRTSVVARVPGRDRARDPLLVHGHLDVVAADAADWTHDPFAAEVDGGCIWGRGAVDMKDMDATILAVVRDRIRTNRPPARDLVLAFFADEEAGGRKGSHWIAANRPDLLDGCAEAVGEVGGFSVDLAGKRRAYLVQTAEKGIAWMRLTARGRTGHGSLPNDDNAVAELARALTRLADHQWPRVVTPTVRGFLDAMSDALGVDLDPDDAETLQRHLGSMARIVDAATRNTINPTVLQAGYKANVVPGHAAAEVDGRFLPGQEEEFFATVDRLLGDRVHREDLNHDVALEAPAHGPLLEAMRESLEAEDPGALVVPYCLFGGTDAKALSTLGIRGYGFAPLRLPPDLDFAGLFHGVDERVPVDGLRFGARVFDRFLDLC